MSAEIPGQLTKSEEAMAEEVDRLKCELKRVGILHNRLQDERAADFAKWFKIINYGGMTEYQAECPQVIDLALRELAMWRWLLEMRLTVHENAMEGAGKWSVLDVDNEIVGRGMTVAAAVADAKGLIQRPA